MKVDAQSLVFVRSAPCTEVEACLRRNKCKCNMYGVADVVYGHGRL